MFHLLVRFQEILVDLWHPMDIKVSFLRNPPEEEAFLRWQAREFHDLEREFASTWRANLESLDLKRIPDEFRKLGISGRNCKTLQEAKSIADTIVNGTDKTLEMLRFAFFVLDIPQENPQLNNGTLVKI